MHPQNCQCPLNPQTLNDLCNACEYEYMQYLAYVHATDLETEYELQ